MTVRKELNLEEKHILVDRERGGRGGRKSDGGFLRVGRSLRRVVDRLTSSVLLIWELPTSQILCRMINYSRRVMPLYELANKFGKKVRKKVVKK